MKSYASVIFLAFCFTMVTTPHQVSAASIKEKSAAIGESCIASGDNSTAMGIATKAGGKGSTAMGGATIASGNYSTAMGFFTEASTLYSTAMGYHTTASNEDSTAMGYETTASGVYSTVVGVGADSIHKLENDIERSFMVGYMSNKDDTTPEFFVKDGGVGIGTKTPYHLLDLGNTIGKKLAVYQKATGDNFYGFGISPGTFEFYVGGDSGAAPKMVIKSDTGRVGIGMSDPGQKLDIAGGNGRLEPGYNWLTSSDQRLKKNISTLEGSLEKISRLRGVRFDTKETFNVDKSNGKHIGVIAQELEKEYPELVVGDNETGYKAVAYDKLTAVLIEAVKELKTKNQREKDLLREQLKKQQAEIEELRSMIGELKS